MAITALNLDAYEYTPAGDEEEPKTVFLITPLTQFEYMKMASVYNTLMKVLNLDEEEAKEIENVKASEHMDAILDFFGSEDADKFKNTFQSFLASHVAEVRNIRNPKSGELETLKKGEFDVNIFAPMLGMELFADAVSRISLSETERKNSK